MIGMSRWGGVLMAAALVPGGHADDCKDFDQTQTRVHSLQCDWDFSEVKSVEDYCWAANNDGIDAANCNAMHGCQWVFLSDTLGSRCAKTRQRFLCGHLSTAMCEEQLGCERATIPWPPGQTTDNHDVCTAVDASAACAALTDRVRCTWEEVAAIGELESNDEKYGLGHCTRFPTDTCAPRSCESRAKTKEDCEKFPNCEWTGNMFSEGCQTRGTGTTCKVVTDAGRRLDDILCSDHSLTGCGFDRNTARCVACADAASAVDCMSLSGLEKCVWSGGACRSYTCKSDMSEEECAVEPMCVFEGGACITVTAHADALKDTLNEPVDLAPLKAKIPSAGCAAAATLTSCVYQGTSCQWDGSACQWNPDCRWRSQYARGRAKLYGITAADGCGDGCHPFVHGDDSEDFFCVHNEQRKGCEDATGQADCDARGYCQWAPFWHRTSTSARQCMPALGCSTNSEATCAARAACRWGKDEDGEGRATCREATSSCRVLKPASSCVEGGVAGRCEGMHPAFYEHESVTLSEALPNGKAGLSVAGELKGDIFFTDSDAKDVVPCTRCGKCAKGYHLNELSDVAQCGTDGVLQFRGQLCVPDIPAASYDLGITACDKGLGPCTNLQRCLSLSPGECESDASCHTHDTRCIPHVFEEYYEAAGSHSNPTPAATASPKVLSYLDRVCDHELLHLSNATGECFISANQCAEGTTCGAVPNLDNLRASLEQVGIVLDGSLDQVVGHGCCFPAAAGAAAAGPALVLAVIAALAAALF